MKNYSKNLNRHFRITKSSGAEEKFSPKKLQTSLQRSGLPNESCQKIARRVTQNLTPGMTTKEIYKKAFKLVQQESSLAAVHYSLKRAILELGPTGFEFEVFVSKYFQELGFDTSVDVIVQGEFVKHEIDVVAKASDSLSFIECKFHNFVGRKNDIKVALYVKARWDDLKNGPEGKHLTDFYLVSNTIFSSDAIDYSKGTGLKLLGVNAPPEESFLEKIIHHKLYPITSLKRLKKYVRDELLKNGVVICKELLQEKKFLLKLRMTEDEIDILFRDVLHLLEDGR
jgi:hypothetical protein